MASSKNSLSDGRNWRLDSLHASKFPWLMLHNFEISELSGTKGFSEFIMKSDVVSLGLLAGGFVGAGGFFSLT